MAGGAFGGKGVPEKATDYHGSARFVRVKPDVAQRGVKSINIDLTFEEALKLSLALQSCVQSLNRYNRSTAKGRAMGLLLSVKMDNNSVSAIEARLNPKQGHT
jgi:hypothetical protein